jgi:dolichol kinase
LLSENGSLITGNIKEEILRKGIHLGTGILMAVLYWFSERNVLAFIHLFFLFGVWSLELLRLKGAIQIPFLRDIEKQKIGAHAFFMLGTFISILIFERRIAIAAILMLTIGDPASGLAQRFMGAKTEAVEGRQAVLKPARVILIMFITSWLVGFLCLGSLVISLFGAIGAAAADGLLLKVRDVMIDDNLTIPLYAGFFMSLALLW